MAFFWYIFCVDHFFDFATKKKKALKKPGDFFVVLFNDNYTPMDFVVDVLVVIFHKNSAEATQLMLEIHNKGKGAAGRYTEDIALTKRREVLCLAAQNGFPLKCDLEKA
jgi:ATP-dependent Clp protease adaptor protein ClpS